MNDAHKTQDPSHLDAGSVARLKQPCAVVLFHSDLTLLGAKCFLEGAGPWVLGRGEPAFTDAGGGLRALDDPCISSRQVRVAWQPKAGVFRVEALPSRREVLCSHPDGRPSPDGQFEPGGQLQVGNRLLLLLTLRSRNPPPGDGVGLVGESEAMLELRRWIRYAADCETHVLLQGEMGAGKELVARAIHEQSRRAGKARIVMSSAEIHGDTAESLLFGHVKGAFTGATQNKEGLFGEASGGTLFLDEIGELALPLQAKLLRVLQEKKATRLGDLATAARPVDVRLISATNANVQTMADRGQFRHDLIYRLPLTCTIPPLRERREDIPLLFRHFLLMQDPVPAWMLRPADTGPPPIPLSYFQELLAHPWRGNVRELEHLVHHLVAKNRPSDTFVPLPLETRLPTPAPSLLPPPPPAPSPVKVQPTPAQIREALGRNGYNIQRAARELDVSHSTLDRLMQLHEIRRAVDCSADQIGQALEASGGDLRRAAQQLEVSERGLQDRMRTLGLTPKRR